MIERMRSPSSIRKNRTCACDARCGSIRRDFRGPFLPDLSGTTPEAPAVLLHPMSGGVEPETEIRGPDRERAAAPGSGGGDLAGAGWLGERA